MGKRGKTKIFLVQAQNEADDIIKEAKIELFQ